MEKLKTYNPCDECLYGIDRRDGSGSDRMCKICEFKALLDRRPAPENKALTLDELRKMDGEPVYAQAGDGTEGWAIVFWNSPETLFLYGPEFDSIFEPDLDFINMTYNDPDGHFGLHIFGWRALRHKPDAETECKKK